MAASIGRILPTLAQAQAGDIFILQTAAGNLILIHNGLAWVQQPFVSILSRTYMADPPPETDLSGTGDRTFTNVTLNGLPSNAVAAVIFAEFQSTAVQAGLFLGPPGQTVSPMIIPVAVSGQFSMSQGVVPVRAGASLQLNYQVLNTGGAAWTALLWLVGYDAPYV